MLSQQFDDLSSIAKQNNYLKSQSSAF